MSLNRNFHKLVSLLRCSLLDKEVDGSLFLSMSLKDWMELIDYSQKEGVCSVTCQSFNNVSLCPIHPDIDGLMEWVGQANYIERSFVTKREEAIKLTIFLHKNDIDVLIMKGLSLSPLYPLPQSREFGDLDIYTFDKHNRANELIRSQGIDIELEAKHDKFNIGNILVEHHNTFLDIDSRTGRLLNEYLISQTSISHCNRTKEGWLVPTPNFNTVYLLRHMSRHLSGEGCTLRNVLDYALFLLKEGDKVDWKSVIDILTKVNMVTTFDTFVAVCGKVLDVDFSRFYINTPNTQLVDRVLDEVANVQLHAEEGYKGLTRFYKKTKRLFSRKWMYDSGLLPDSFWKEIVKNSMTAHINNPKYL